MPKATKLKAKRPLAAAVITAAVALTTVLHTPAAHGAVTAPLDDRLAPDHVAAARVKTSATAESALAIIQSRIARYVATNGTTYTFGSYVDPDTGRIVLETDAPTEVVAALTAFDTSASPAMRDAARRVWVRHATATDLWHRRDDIPPYYGGGGIRSGSAICSSGYAVRNAAGARFSVTAGHCFPNGATVLTESGTSIYGTVSNRRLPTVTGHPMDFELIGGRSYAGRVFVGGVRSSNSIPVVSAGSAVVGYADYCHSGRTTGERCNHRAISITAQVCTQTGCKSPVIAFTGGRMVEPGDSGGAFYAKDSRGAWIRGNVIATNGTTGWAQPWTTISSNLGVSIVTG